MGKAQKKIIKRIDLFILITEQEKTTQGEKAN